MAVMAVRSLYWMFCQMGFGLSEIVAATELEVIFGLTASIAGLAIFSFFLGTGIYHVVRCQAKIWGTETETVLCRVDFSTIYMLIYGYM